MKRIIALLLTGLLLFACVGCITITGLSCSVPVRYSNADKYTAGNFTYESDKVDKVEIEWAAGGIKLLNGKGTLSVTESGSDDLSEDEQMHWWLDGKTLKIKGYPLAWNSPTNQQFVILSDAEAEKLRAFVGFDLWGRADEGHWIARFTSSWSTTDADVDALEAALPPKTDLSK